MLIVGLTGGIATGKSTVSNAFRQEGIPIVDADVLARKVVEPGQAAYTQILDAFSSTTPDLLLPDKQLNRPALGRRIFNDDTARRKLNGITHPAVRKAMVLAALKYWITGHALLILDVPLLFEGGLDFFCGTNIVVACSDAEQLKRLIKRDPHLSHADAQSRIAAQMAMEEKRMRADIVIDNDGSIDDLKSKVSAISARIRPNYALTLLEWLVPPFGVGIGLWVLLQKYLSKRKTTRTPRSKL